MIERKKVFFTTEEYLAMEEKAESKNEYYRGEIFAISGGSADHSRIAINLTLELSPRIAHQPCEIFNSDLRLLIEKSELYTYPDLMVVCGKIEFVPHRKDTIKNPILTIEVLSESTREYDRGQKYNFSKQIPSLQEYILIESESARVECYRRTADNQWTVESYDGLDAIVKIQAVEFEISSRKIYSKVSWLD